VADGYGPAHLKQLAAAFEAAGAVTAAGQTAAQSEQSRARALKAKLPDGVRSNTHAVCSAVQKDVEAFLPTSDPGHVLTADDARRVQAVYARLTAACLEAAK
jgi:hypothetical protein